tara:strand:- start:411 stop:560 length:150 start_codon:yes stop_codon:yes gene_type:complete
MDGVVMVEIHPQLNKLAVAVVPVVMDKLDILRIEQVKVEMERYTLLLVL